MELWVLGPTLLGALFVLVRAHRRNVDHLASQRGDLRRAGEGPSPQQAALRATGTNSWMRPGGGF